MEHMTKEELHELNRRDEAWTLFVFALVLSFASSFLIVMLVTMQTVGMARILAPHLTWVEVVSMVNDGLFLLFGMVFAIVFVVAVLFSNFSAVARRRLYGTQD